MEAGRIDAVMNLVGEMIIGKSMLQRAIAEFERRHEKDPLRGKLADALGFQSRVLGELQKSVMKIRMVPVEQLFRRFPRVVRDVARLRGKDINLEITGENTDLDKGILDALADPLAHLVRNAADHGIEMAAQRQAAGKPPRGTIRLNAYHDGDQVVIEVSDDGRGLDREKIVQPCHRTRNHCTGSSPATKRIRIPSTDFLARTEHGGRGHRDFRARRRTRRCQVVDRSAEGVYRTPKQSRRRHHISPDGAAHTCEYPSAPIPDSWPALRGAARFGRRNHADH